jgi:hypothetical protein
MQVTLLLALTCQVALRSGASTQQIIFLLNPVERQLSDCMCCVLQRRQGPVGKGQ